MSLAMTNLQHEQIKTRWNFWIRELAGRKRSSDNDALTCEPIREKLGSIAASAEAVGLLSLPSIPLELAQLLDDDPAFFGLEEMMVKRPEQAQGTNTGQKIKVARPEFTDANKGQSNISGGVKSLTSLISIPKERLMDDFPEGIKGRDDDIRKWEKQVERGVTMALGKTAPMVEGEQAAAATETPQAEATPVTPGNPDTPNPTPTLTKAEKLKAQNAARKASLAEKKAKDGASAEPKAPKVKKEKTLGPCLDGCGQQVGGRFAVGHDAKLKSLLVKVERGEVATEDIPEVAQPYIKLKKAGVEETTAKDGTKVKIQHFEITKSPVRFPGRPEIEYAILEDGRGN